MTRGVRAILVLGLFTGLFEIAAAQEPARGTSAGEEQAEAVKRPPKGQPDSDQKGLGAGTKFTAQLESSLDAKTAKPGDEISARVSQNVKENGRVAIRKGDRLVGHVTEVKSGANDGSMLGIKFDRLVSGSETMRTNAVLASIISTPSEMRSENEEAPEPMIAPGPAPARAGGGLLGGAGSTVGRTASTVGGATGGLESAVGTTTRGTLGATTGLPAQAGAMLSTPIRAVRVSSVTGAQGSAESSSMLSTRQGNLRLESGTRLQFRVASNGQAHAN